MGPNVSVWVFSSGCEPSVTRPVLAAGLCGKAAPAPAGRLTGIPVPGDARPADPVSLCLLRICPRELHGGKLSRTSHGAARS